MLVNNVGAVTSAARRVPLDHRRGLAVALNQLPRRRADDPRRPAAPARRGGGTIVNDLLGQRVPARPLVIDYSAAKAALANFSKALSKELGPRGIRVNTVSPGPVATDLWLGDRRRRADRRRRPAAAAPDAVAEQAAGQPPTGRFTTPQEVADLVVLLASGRAGNVTGADFVIDGGLIQTL